jgi:molecular chaperone HtpG
MNSISKPTIGKDVIESLTFSMYEDSRFIFREYIQNSADQIDKAVKLGILPSIQDGYIDICIEKSSRKITIEDNATGIKALEVVNVLRNVASSNKVRGVDKGFRGIGRLGGVAYCEKLIFETSYKGENIKSIMIWDAALLRDIINNRKVKEDAADVLNRVTSFKTEGDLPEKHYFKVILENVTKENLLDKRDIRNYLSMVAPVPFHARFLFTNKIREDLEKNNLKLDDYRIYLNNEDIYKAYTTRIYDKNWASIDDDIFDIKTFTLFNSNGERLVWGWYGINTFKGVIPENNLARGFRLRKDNIQIGSDSTLIKLHKRERDNYYFVGEVHAMHPDLIPNARRDYFSENECLEVFEDELRKLFTRLNKMVYKVSGIRSASKKIEKFEDFQADLNEKQFTDKDEKMKIEKEFDEKKEKAIKAQKALANMQSKISNKESPMGKIYEKIVKKKDNDIDRVSNPLINQNKIPFITDNLSRLPKEQRKLVSKIYAIIKRELPPNLAETLIQKIQDELK